MQTGVFRFVRGVQQSKGDGDAERHAGFSLKKLIEEYPAGLQKESVKQNN